MFEAARTTASPAAIWTICIVALSCLVFWLGAIAVADRYPFWRHWQAQNMPGPTLGGIDMAEGGRSVAPNPDAPAVLAEPPELPAQRAGTADRPERSVTGDGG